MGGHRDEVALQPIELAELIVRPLQRFDEVGVVDGDRRLGGDDRQRLQVVLGERTAALVEGLDDPDATVAHPHRYSA